MKHTPTAGTPATKRLRVLIVDDQESVRELVAELVGHAGHAVVGTAQNGVEAIARAAELRPEVVILDIRMPQMNGIDAMHAILAAGTTSRILLFSGIENPALPRHVLNQGVVFLAKPFDITALVKLLTQWRTELS